MKMRFLLIVTVLSISTFSVIGQSHKRSPAPSPSPVVIGGSEVLDKVKWQKGPSIGDLGSAAQVHVPAGYIFAGGDDTRLIMEAKKNPLDADAMLDSIKAGTEAGNKERIRRGWPTMSIIGWEQKPRYDESTHNL